MQQVSSRVWVETGLHGCNAGFIVTEEGVVMVECPQLPSDASRWRREVMAHRPLRYLVHTEGHIDHVLSDFLFPEATVVAHELTRQAILGLSLDQIRQRVSEADREGLSLMEGYRLCPPSITFGSELNLYMGRVTLELVHLPGHSAGQTAVYLPQEGVVFTGDNVVNNVQPVMREALPLEWLGSLDRLASLDVSVIVPGHGEVCGKKYLAEQAATIREWIAAVESALREGWSEEEAKSRISFLGRYPMGVGTESRALNVQRSNVERLYRVLSTRRAAESPERLEAT